MIGIDNVDTKDSKSNSEQRSCSPMKGGRIALCARHDVEIGRYVLEVEPRGADFGPDLLFYLRLVDEADGDVCWQGALTMAERDGWAPDVYGGRPLQAEMVDTEVESS